MNKLKVLAALALVTGLIGAMIAQADSRTIRFEASEGYTTGSIQGQQGWGGQNPPGIPINPAYDQAVVNNTYGYTSFGAQSWRISNAVTSGSFGDWPFSPSLANEAGETSAQNGNGVFTFSGGTRQSHFEVQWDFASTVPGSEQAGLQVSTAPDRGDGARMSFIRMTDNPTGLAVVFADYQDASPYGSYGTPASAALGCGPEDDFILTTVASGLNRTRPHTIRLTMDLVDGPRNDVVKVYVDGTLRHKGTSWEDYFRWCAESGGGTGTTTADQSRTVDSMIFQARSGAGTAPATAGKGFLIDNLTYFSSQGRCHKGDGDGDFDDKDGHKHHAHFHRDSCENGGGDVEENDDSGKHFQSTSVSSATFASDTSSQTLTMVGTGVQDGIPVGFTMVAVDNGDLAPGVFTLVLTNGYSVTGSLVNGSIVIQ